MSLAGDLIDHNTATNVRAPRPVLLRVTASTRREWTLRVEASGTFPAHPPLRPVVQNGGAVADYQSALDVTGAVFESNSAGQVSSCGASAAAGLSLTRAQAGGAIHSFGASITAVGANFSANMAGSVRSRNRGAVSTLVVSNAITSSQSGGAVADSSTGTAAVFDATNASFTLNHAVVVSGYQPPSLRRSRSHQNGGAVQSKGFTTKATGANFTANTAGAVRLRGRFARFLVSRFGLTGASVRRRRVRVEHRQR